MRYLFLWLLLPVWVMGQAELPFEPKNYAVIFAPQEYQPHTNWTTLVNTRGEAQKLKQVLETYYVFDTVILVENPTTNDFLATMAHLKKKITNDDNLLIYFNGHGSAITDKKLNRKTFYWAFVDSKEGDKTSMVCTDSINKTITKIPHRHLLLLIDACYGGGIFAQGEVTKGDEDAPRKSELELMQAFSSYAISSAAENLVKDGNSFFSILIDILENNNKKYLSQFDLLSALRSNIMQLKDTSKSDSSKTVMLTHGYLSGGKMGGEFFFKKIMDWRKEYKGERADYFNAPEGLALVTENGNKYGFVDKTGEMVIPLVYDYADNFSEGLALVRKGGKYGWIDKTGKIVIPLEYDFAHSFSEGLACVRKNRKYGFIDQTGKVVIALEYDYADSFFSEGLALVVKGGNSSFVNKIGKKVFALEDDIDSCGPFIEGLARVERNRKCGFIDKTGKIVIALEYDYADSFTNGQVEVLKDGKFFYINTLGECVEDCP